MAHSNLAELSSSEFPQLSLAPSPEETADTPASFIEATIAYVNQLDAQQLDTQEVQ
ncbi:MAG TPA: hypothetical protein VHX11_09010 [Acidobacteriaceae bacterium]|jgi:hypothetical protein|nr:hypothetical protein [Acidobacteriaceae bacterium]